MKNAKEYQFYPTEAPVPEELRTERFILRPLRATDVELDFEAVMSSATALRLWSQSNWPADDFTLEENLDDLQRHEREHKEQRAFTFTVLNPSETRCLGCVYIQPLWEEAAQLCKGCTYTAAIGFWVRTSELINNLDEHLLNALRSWFNENWEFDCVVFTINPRDKRQKKLFSNMKNRIHFKLADGCDWEAIR